MGEAKRKEDARLERAAQFLEGKIANTEDPATEEEVARLEFESMEAFQRDKSNSTAWIILKLCARIRALHATIDDLKTPKLIVPGHLEGDGPKILTP